MRKLQNGAEAKECEILKQYLQTDHWVTSKFCALNALARDWKYTVLHLEGTGNKTGEEAAAAGALLKKLKSFRFR